MTAIEYFVGGILLLGLLLLLSLLPPALFYILGGLLALGVVAFVVLMFTTPAGPPAPPKLTPEQERQAMLEDYAKHPEKYEVRRVTFDPEDYDDD